MVVLGYAAADSGYRVCRIEQTETPEQAQQREGRKSAKVRREVVGMVSAGTCVRRLSLPKLARPPSQPPKFPGLTQVGCRNLCDADFASPVRWTRRCSSTTGRATCCR